MASKQAYLEYVLDQLSGLDGVTYRAMMGEFVLYCHGKVIGGIYDNRLLMKPCAAAERLLAGVQPELPYPGGKPMLPVPELDDREFLCGLVQAVSEEMPAPKKRARRTFEIP